jgi:hypothetical protein
MQKLIHADFDDSGVYVYQAFKPQTVQIAAGLGTFGKGFGFDRISWIKPSFGWVLQRSEYATKHRMEGIARIKISHAGFLEMLNQSVEAHWNVALFPVEDAWKSALNQSDVIHQWDPERDMIGRRMEGQAIQIGLRGEILKRYVHEFILGVEDATRQARTVGTMKFSGKKQIKNPFAEREYPVSEELFHQLGCER